MTAQVMTYIMDPSIVWQSFVSAVHTSLSRIHGLTPAKAWDLPAMMQGPVSLINFVCERLY